MEVGEDVKAKLSQVGIRDLALFAVLSAVTAIAVLVSASELCACGPQRASSAAGGQPEPLTLTLSGPQVCETDPGYEALGSILHRNGRREVYSIGWTTPAEVEVSWEVSGGSVPYTLTIDGESRDNFGTLAGASGAGWVSCALEHGEAFYEDDEGQVVSGYDYRPSRYYREQPTIDSGLKTIQATVTDAGGQTAKTSIDVYVILSRGGTGELLEGGKTYRVLGELLTIPAGIDLTFSGIESGFGGYEAYILKVVGHPAVILLSWGTNREVVRDLPPTDGAGGASGDALDLGAKFDELVDSAGRLPTGIPGN